MRRGIFDLPVVVIERSPSIAMAVHGQLTCIHKVERVKFNRHMRYEAESPLFDDISDHVVLTPMYKISVDKGRVTAVRVGN
ncbi:MAG: hypothetical protein HGJ94_14015 [Desulfosarcina sp.]|nr:hypothetical protein [Desulfosarcina sp.]MBC2741553.1 hypothetical protein [Desulfosarcina sp.]MBC2764467.1 hypothetical protein [Desulfosarcina sp.]